MHIMGTKALDLDCPKCGVLAGVYCNDDKLCQERKNAAAKRTKDANAALRSKKP